MGHSKSSPKSENSDNITYHRKQDKSKINNITIHLNKLKKEQQSPKLIKERK